jgi:hypothetical protein
MSWKNYLIPIGFGLVGFGGGLIIYKLAIAELSAFANHPQSLNDYLQASITIVALLVSVGSLIFVEVVKSLASVPERSRSLMMEYTKEILEQAEGKNVKVDNPQIVEANRQVDGHNKMVVRTKRDTLLINIVALFLFGSAGLCIGVDVYLFVTPLTALLLALSFGFAFMAAFELLAIIQVFFLTMRTNIEILKFPKIEQEDLN